MSGASGDRVGAGTSGRNQMPLWSKTSRLNNSGRGADAPSTDGTGLCPPSPLQTWGQRCLLIGVVSVIDNGRSLDWTRSGGTWPAKSMTSADRHIGMYVRPSVSWPVRR